MSHFLSFWIFHRRTNKNQKNESLKKLSIVLQRNLYIHSKVRARKLKILYIFFKFKGHIPHNCQQSSNMDQIRSSLVFCDKIPVYAIITI